MWKVCSVQDLEALARSRVPKPFFDYVAAGSWTETTLRENVDQLSRFHKLLNLNLTLTLTRRCFASDTCSRTRFLKTDFPACPRGRTKELRRDDAQDQVPTARAARHFEAQRAIHDARGSVRHARRPRALRVRGDAVPERRDPRGTSCTVARTCIANSRVTACGNTDR